MRPRVEREVGARLSPREASTFVDEGLNSAEILGGDGVEDGGLIGAAMRRNGEPCSQHARTVTQQG